MDKLAIFFVLLSVTSAYGQRPLIKGLTDAKEGQFPYQAYFFYVAPNGAESANCAGSIIHKHWILTAAHCILQTMGSPYVRVGTLNHNTGGVVRAVTKMIRHERFQESYDASRKLSAVLNDIALLRLDADLQFDNKVQPVKLPSATNKYEHTQAFIPGWGRIGPGDSAPTSDYLRYIIVEVLTIKECKVGRWADPFILTDDHMCTSTVRGQSTCGGDSGGPVVVGNTQIGIVSFSDDKCRMIGAPNVQAKVSKYVPWIIQQLGMHGDTLKM